MTKLGSRWYSVVEAMPPIRMRVLVAKRDHEDYVMIGYSDDQNVFWDDCENELQNIYWWKVIPYAPISKSELIEDVKNDIKG